MPKISGTPPPISRAPESLENVNPSKPSATSGQTSPAPTKDQFETHDAHGSSTKEVSPGLTAPTKKAEQSSSKAPAAVPLDMADSVALLTTVSKLSKPNLKIEKRSLSKSTMSCKFYPRMRGRAVGVVRDKNTGLFSQGTGRPEFKAGRGAARNETKLMEDAVKQCSCLVHGIDARWIGPTLERGSLSSGYALRGPEGSYSRDADRNGGGATAVYTRAVGVSQDKWLANGFGVGSNEARVQLVLSPEMLNNPDHCWRSSSMDGMGKLPGVTRSLMADVNSSSSKVDAFDAWEQQSEKDRHYQFEASVKGAQLENNEQLHWESVPLTDSLAALVCSSSAMETLKPLCREDADGNPYVPFGDRRVPVIVAGKADGLISKLSERGVTNADGQVRL